MPISRPDVDVDVEAFRESVQLTKRSIRTAMKSMRNMRSENGDIETEEVKLNEGERQDRKRCEPREIFRGIHIPDMERFEMEAHCQLHQKKKLTSPILPRVFTHIYTTSLLVRRSCNQP